MVVLVGVDGVFGDDFSGLSVDGDGVSSVDEDEDGAVFVGSSDAEVAEFACVSQCDRSGVVYFVVADPPDFVEHFEGWFCFSDASVCSVGGFDGR